MKWLNRWFSFSWKKLVLVAGLVPLMWLCHETEFRRVDSFVLDLMQFLNNSKNVEKNLITVNINGTKDTFARPFKINTFKTVFEKILSYSPKQIILCISIRELNDETKTELLKYLKDKPNIYIQNDYSFPTNNFYKDPLFKDFPRFLAFSSTIDSRDKKSRRVLLFYDKEGITDEFEVLKSLGFSTKSLDHFEHHFRLWETTQVNMKSFKLGAFGSFDARDILNDKIQDSYIAGKTVLLGSFDEYSMSALASVFNFADKTSGDNFKSFYFPHVDNMANMLNTFITGDYIKSLPQLNDLIVTSVLLFFLIFINLQNKKKIILLLSIIPCYIFLIAVVYVFSSFYLDFSRSIVLLFFLQYLGIPIIMFSMFKEQESKKLQEINDARIDALFTVSEKVAHDIRSPLSVITLLQDKTNFSDPEYTVIFNSAVKRIDETATKILTRYRTKIGGENELSEKINLISIVLDIIKEKKVLNQKIDFVFDSHETNGYAIGSKLDLERIISNILDNSIYALKNTYKPRISINMKSHNKMVQLLIIDNGSGIPEHVVNLLGNQRVTTKSENNEGNGIGLLHAKRVIEQLSGIFIIKSHENVGTTIEIQLPEA